MLTVSNTSDLKQTDRARSAESFVSESVRRPRGASRGIGGIRRWSVDSDVSLYTTQMTEAFLGPVQPGAPHT
jgi:hypothetical protein